MRLSDRKTSSCALIHPTGVGAPEGRRCAPKLGGVGRPDRRRWPTAQRRPRPRAPPVRRPRRPSIAALTNRAINTRKISLTRVHGERASSHGEESRDKATTAGAARRRRPSTQVASLQSTSSASGRDLATRVRARSRRPPATTSRRSGAPRTRPAASASSSTAERSAAAVRWSPPR